MVKYDRSVPDGSKMLASRLNNGLEGLRRAALLRDGAGLADGQLLECFVTRHEEAAFEAIVRRHGPMVMGVCRRVLGNRHDAEDAFQATFLVLVRKAGAIMSRELLANWLYGVAYNTALKAKAATARRRVCERRVAEMAETKTAGQDLGSDLRPVLDVELSRLPEKYRVPIILCDLEGKTRKEAARQLGWPEGTLSGRLARGRRLLAAKLTRRGVAIASASLAMMLSQQVSARVSAALVSATVQAAAVFESGRVVTGTISAKVAALAEGVLKSMLTAKLKTATAVLGGLMILAAATSQVAGLYDQDRPASAGKAPNAERIDQLIRQLGSRKFADRVAAGKALAEIGEAALPALRRTAANGIDLETCRRAEDLVRKIERRWELFCFKGHTDAIPGAVLSPNGQLILSAGRSESSPRLWDVKTGKELRQFHGHTGWVWSVASTPDGKRAISAGVDGMRLWNVQTGKELRRFGFPAVDGNRGMPLVEARIPEAKFGGHTRQIYRVVISADGRRALSGSQDRTVRLWDVETGKHLGCFDQHTDEIFTVALSPDGRRAVSTSADKTMRLWEVDKGKVLHQLPGASCAVFSPDGRHVLSGGRDKFMRLWDVKTGKELCRFRGHGAAVVCVAFSRDGKQALSGSADNTVRLWDVTTAKELRCFHGHNDGPSSVAFCPDGKRALSASYDMTMRLWQLPK
jgi:RNA polymerase sigma factor (sigma-70 family)